jgi:hypothetical protein
MKTSLHAALLSDLKMPLHFKSIYVLFYFLSIKLLHSLFHQFVSMSHPPQVTFILLIFYTKLETICSKQILVTLPYLYLCSYVQDG